MKYKGKGKRHKNKAIAAFRAIEKYGRKTMNILFCGDRNIEDGLVISILSLMENCEENICVYVLTLDIKDGEYLCCPVGGRIISYLDGKLKTRKDGSFIKKIDITDLFEAGKPEANMKTRFTPGCMLRLYSDLIPELPDKILYLDNDVICRRDISELYSTNMDGAEVAGVLDYYGSWFFRNEIWHRDYLNSGVLLFNLKEIKKTGLFEKCRKRCSEKKMFMPDQSAINSLAENKIILPRKYNEQRKLHKDTVIQHFTTSFRFFPWIHTVAVKPWDTDRVHKVLRLHEYDEILEKYKECIAEVDGEKYCSTQS